MCTGVVEHTDVHDPVRLRYSTLPSVLAPRFKPSSQRLKLNILHGTALGSVPLLSRRNNLIVLCKQDNKLFGRDIMLFERDIKLFGRDIKLSEQVRLCGQDIIRTRYSVFGRDIMLFEQDIKFFGRDIMLCERDI